MKPEVFNYADYERLKAENEALKAQIKAMTADLRERPICVRCKHWDAERNDYSVECINCGWHPWNDEEEVPCIWEWRGVSNG